MDDPDEVAARLRQKIRSQAEELLLKVEKSSSRRNHSDTANGRGGETAATTTTAAAAGGTFSKTRGGGGEDSSESSSVEGTGHYEITRSRANVRPQAAEQSSSLFHGDSLVPAPASQGTPAPASSSFSQPSRPPPASSTSPSLDSSAAATTGDLTKRLQRLALERQKESKADRLRVIQSDTSSHLSSVKTFQELNLPPFLLDALFQMGFDRPSAIQEEALPRILADPPRNLIGQAQSGSGKTAAFTLGMLYRIVLDSPSAATTTKTQALCVTPTRELAIQIVEKAVAPMAVNMEGLKIQLAISKTAVPDAKTGVDAHLVVGTPGKIVDWLKRRYIRTDHIKVFVLDEADTMVSEQGHRANSLLIEKKLPKKCQRLLFSATFAPEVLQFASKMLDRPDKILLTDQGGPASLVLDVIKQLWIDTREYVGGSKVEFLADIYSLLTIGQSVVFVNTKGEADLVHQTLGTAGYTCSVLHSGVEPEERDDTMERFRQGESNVLITTNVLARGVDVENVCLVINYNVPVLPDQQPDYDTYLHRIGRTGRFGRKGTAITLVDDEQSMTLLAQIEAYFTATAGEELIVKAPANPEALTEYIEI